MPVPTVLCYNFPAQRAARLRATCESLGCRARFVAPEEFGLRLGFLAGVLELDDTIETGEPFSQETLLLAGFNDGQLTLLLRELKKHDLNVPLKALLTETNATWSSYALHRHISAEWAELRRQIERAGKG